jgi:hypothetical protein
MPPRIAAFVGLPPTTKSDDRWLYARIALLFVFFTASFVNGITLGFAPPTMPPLSALIGLPLCFVFPALSLGFQLRRFRKNNLWSAPDWRENPFRRSEPLQFYHFGGYFFIAVGVGTAIGAAMSGHFMSVWPALCLVSGMTLSFGLGILLAVRISRL